MRHLVLTALLLSLAGGACRPSLQDDIIVDDMCQPRREFVNARIVQATSPTVASDGVGLLLLRFPREIAEFGSVAGAYLLGDSTETEGNMFVAVDSSGQARVPFLSEGRRFLRLRAIGFESTVVAFHVRRGFVDTLLVDARTTECRRAAG